MRQIRLTLMMAAALTALADDNAAAEKKKEPEAPQITNEAAMEYLAAYVVLSNAQDAVRQAQENFNQKSAHISQLCGGNRNVNMDTKTGKVNCGDLLPNVALTATPVKDEKKKK